LSVLSIPAQESRFSEPVYDFFHWENVGVIKEISGKTIYLERTLNLSDKSWSLEPGAVSAFATLHQGDRVFAQGKTLSTGAFDTTRIYLLAREAARPQTSGGSGIVRGSDYGGPEESRPPILDNPGRPVGRGGGDTPGQETRTPGPGRPGDAGRADPGGLQNPRASRLTKFNSWDADGIIEGLSASSLTLRQIYFLDSDTLIKLPEGEAGKKKDLKPGMRIAITVRDKVDEKTQAIKAQVIRVLSK
jgi:hypothetical protein